MRRRLLALGVIALLAGGLGLHLGISGPTHSGAFTPPDGAVVTFYPAPEKEDGLPLVVSAAIEPGFMRPFLLAFQRHNRGTSIAYVQAHNGAVLAGALGACRRGEQAADLYLTSSTDHLIRLANEGCAQRLPSAIGRSAPAQAAWRDQVIAFTVEPAAFVFARRYLSERPVLPMSHGQLLSWLRSLTPGQLRIGIYDVEASADGYDFAASDSRQAALYGRLLESFGRVGARRYCCSNVMVDAVDRGEIVFAYNVQLSYAYAAQRAGSRIVVYLPNDFQALQTVSLMVPLGARDATTATKLAAFLVSDEARTIARQDLAPPGMTPGEALASADQLLAQASVSPVALSLQDRARRDHLIREWRQAVEP